MKPQIALWLLAALLAAPAVYAADPSPDDIINALKPDAGALTGATRGIRMVTTTGTATPSAGAPAAAASEGPSLDMSIQFESGSATLTSAATTQLDSLGKALASSALASYRFRIEGHTDTVGSADTNQQLSAARASAVANYLEAKYGITATRLQPVGLGEAGLLVQTPDQTAEPKNRRVHIVNLGA
jgi:OmpA-OmpF porin, OOP family